MLLVVGFSIQGHDVCVGGSKATCGAAVREVFFVVGWFMVLVMHYGDHVLPGPLPCRLIFQAFVYGGDTQQMGSLFVAACFALH